MKVKLDSMVAVFARPGSYSLRPTLPLSMRVGSVTGPLICLKEPAATELCVMGISYRLPVRESLTSSVPSDMI